MIFNDFWLVTTQTTLIFKITTPTKVWKGPFLKLFKQHAVRRALLGLKTLGYLYSYFSIDFCQINFYIITHAQNVSAHEIHPDRLCMVRYAVKQIGERETES